MSFFMMGIILTIALPTQDIGQNHVKVAILKSKQCATQPATQPFYTGGILEYTMLIFMQAVRLLPCSLIFTIKVK